MRCDYGVALIFAVWPAASTALTRKQARGEPEPGTPVAQTGRNGLLARGGPGPDTTAGSSSLSDPRAGGEGATPVEGEGGRDSDDALGNTTLYDVDEWVGTEPVFTSEERRQLLADTNGHRNLCLKGSLMPELLVIGAIKAGTTTFCSTLRYSPSTLFPRAQRRWRGSTQFPAKWKEGHYFDKHVDQGMSYMLRDYGRCDRRFRLIGVDGSAAYGVEHRVPARIRSWYKDLAWHLKFVLVMREPVNRLHSHYYHSLDLNVCSELETKPFRAAVLDILSVPPLQWMTSVYANLGTECRAFLEGSLYTSQIQLYFEYFEPSQFTFVPFLYNVAPGQGGRSATHPAKTLWERLGAHGAEPPVLHSNNRRHRKLTSDLAPKEIARLRAWFNTVTGPLMIARLLYNTKAILHDFSGTRSVENVSAWIAKNW